MVTGDHVEALDSGQTGESRVGFERHGVADASRVLARARAILRQVLVQAAALDQGEQLHAVADAEHRSPSLQRRTREQDVEVLLVRGHGLRRAVGRAEAEPGRVEVVAAGQQEAVELGDNPRDVGGPPTGAITTGMPPARKTASA